MTDTTRRTVLAGAAGITATVALAACGDNETPSSGTGTQPTAGGATTAATAGSASASGGAAAGLGALADIPVGGGRIYTAEKVVVTQPTAGQVKAFSTTCTHQQCAVTKVEKGEIVCPCHNSRFKIADGSVAQGPATKPLAEKTVKVEGGQVVLG